MLPSQRGTTNRMTAYYNENDPFAAQWLENLINAGHIAPGVVDKRDIREVHTADLKGFTQCHFFAGIGVWSYALRCDAWADNRPVWTGYCPCQPFSLAGRRAGLADERHLWPTWCDLILEHRPATMLGEQVASKDALAWWDVVSSELEREGYASGAADLCAASIGAPHIRQRLFWVAHSQGEREQQARRERAAAQRGGTARGMDIPTSGRHGAHNVEPIEWGRECPTGSANSIHARGMGHTQSEPGRLPDRPERLPHPESLRPSETGGAGPLDGFWRDADWLHCRDGKWRPVSPGASPLAHGAPTRVGRLRAYGNAIVAPLATQFIKAVID